MTPVLTTEDLQKIKGLFEPRFLRLEGDVFGIKEDIRTMKNGVQAIDGKIDSLTSSVDEFLHTSRRHDDELVVLRAQTGRIRDVLVEKGVATESELSVLGKSKETT